MAQARRDEMVGRLREKFAVDEVEGEFVVLVGRNGGMFVADQVDTWRRARGFPDTGTNVWRWIASLGERLDTGLKKFPLKLEGVRGVEVYQLLGRKIYRELEMENSRARLPVENNATLVEIKRRLVRVGAVLSRWWYPWLGSAEASVAWCKALSIDRAVLPHTRYGTAGKDRPSYFADRSPHAAEGSHSLFVYPLVLEGRDETRGLEKWCRSYAPLWEALGRAGVTTTAVVARSAETLSVPVADVLRGWEMSDESHRAVQGIRFDTDLDCVLAGNYPAVIESHGGPEGVARRRRELAAAIKEARAGVGPGVTRTEELVLEEVPA